jgi:hypothetical protein
MDNQHLGEYEIKALQIAWIQFMVERFIVSQSVGNFVQAGFGLLMMLSTSTVCMFYLLHSSSFVQFSLFLFQI